MEELIATIYEITVDIDRKLKEERYEEFEKLLNQRNSLMMKVNTLKENRPNYQYTTKEKQLLEDTFHLDQQLTTQLKENMVKNQALLNQIKQNKQVSKKYHPYIKQTNGVFVEAKR